MAEVSPALAETLARPIVDAYLEAERILLERIARSLAQGIDSPEWAERKLLELQLLRTQTRHTITALDQAIPALVDEAVRTAWNRGSALAAADLARVLGGTVSDYTAPLPGRLALDRLVAEAVTATKASHTRILRWTDDVYRQTVAAAAPQVLLGTQTRVQVAQRVLDQFAAKGVTGFVDTAGRSWALDSYAEMAVRTTAGHAAIEGNTDRLRAHGITLVMVTDVPGECEICRPWEGKVLALDDIPVIGVPEVVGTLAQAVGAGLYHANCRHTHSAYLPGRTRPMFATQDPGGERDRQQLRYLERQTRAWKRREAAALTDDAAARARAKVAEYQGRIRQHVDATGLIRQRHREQVGVAH